MSSNISTMLFFSHAISLFVFAQLILYTWIFLKCSYFDHNIGPNLSTTSFPQAHLHHVGKARLQDSSPHPHNNHNIELHKEEGSK